jgi:hypothetical protein
VSSVSKQYSGAEISKKHEDFVVRLFLMATKDPEAAIRIVLSSRDKRYGISVRGRV